MALRAEHRLRGMASRCGARAIRTATRGATALFLLISAAIIGAAPAAAEDPTPFSALSTPELLELTADLGEELHARGVSEDYVDPTTGYAGLLATRAFELEVNSGAMTGPDGKRYYVAGARRISSGDVLTIGPFDQTTSDEFDLLVIVVFRRDFQIDRAVIAPRDVVAATDGSAITLDDAFWSAAGVRDVTGPMYLAASRD